MTQETACIKCHSTQIYFDSQNWICLDCQCEWNDETKNQFLRQEEAIDSTPVYKDAHGQILQDGDSVTLVKDLKIKGSSSVIKGGTKVKNIKLHDAGDGHDISCRIEGFGAAPVS